MATLSERVKALLSGILPVGIKLRNCVGVLSAMRVIRLSAAEQNAAVNEHSHQWSRPS